MVGLKAGNGEGDKKYFEPGQRMESIGNSLRRKSNVVIKLGNGNCVRRLGFAPVRPSFRIAIRLYSDWQETDVLEVLSCSLQPEKYCFRITLLYSKNRNFLVKGPFPFGNGNQGLW
jgi:hypothetical protein